MVTEPMYVSLNERELSTQLGIHTDAAIPGLWRLTEAVHAVGGLMMAHINHAGRAANPKLIPAKELVSASDVLCPANQVTPRPLSRAEIADAVAAFGAAAQRSREAGFDALEIPRWGRVPASQSVGSHPGGVRSRVENIVQEDMKK